MDTQGQAGAQAPSGKAPMGKVLLAVGIFFGVVILLFGGIYAFYAYESTQACGEGKIIGDSNTGFYCGFAEEREGETCASCAQVCASNGLTERPGYCGPSSIEVRDISFDEEGNLTLDLGPPMCYCCCDRKE